MNTTTNKRGRAALALAGITLGASTMVLAATGPAHASGNCRFTVNGMTPLDLQEGGNGDEIMIIMNRETFGNFRFPAATGQEVLFDADDATKVFTDQITVRVSEDDFSVNDKIGKPLTFACQAGSDTVDYQDNSAHYQLRYTITQLP
jgi:hypothetical protein